jgi:hypothetical protein
MVWVCANSDVIHAFVPPTLESPEEMLICPLDNPNAMRARMIAIMM